jgi:hypothetical protein
MKLKTEIWHCNGQCDKDVEHEILIVDEDLVKKTKCTKCKRETWR